MSRMCVYTQLDEALNLKQLGWLDDPLFHIIFPYSPNLHLALKAKTKNGLSMPPYAHKHCME